MSGGDLQRVSAKFFVSDPDAIGPAAAEYIPVFHRWIQEGDIPGLLVDVADYGHVPDGPGVMLIGHEADRALEFRDGIGFSYQRKRDATGDARERLVEAIEQARAGATRLANDPDLAVAFRADQIELRIADRLNAPNTEETFAALAGDLEDAVTTVYPDVTPHLERLGDERRPLTVLVSANGDGSNGFALSS